MDSINFRWFTEQDSGELPVEAGGRHDADTSKVRDRHVASGDRLLRVPLQGLLADGVALIMTRPLYAFCATRIASLSVACHHYITRGVPHDMVRN